VAERVLTSDQIRAFADLSHDHNPLHVDETVAARSPFGSIVAHGFLLLGQPLTALAGKVEYPKTLECRFLLPGRPGDELATEVEVDGSFTVRIRGQEAVVGRVSAGK
jgi:3-hydroxybutyryl-CoA dehydratase